MIENLSGIHETVNYKSNTHLRLYENNINESYPKHWHSAIEIIMAVENSYIVGIGDCHIHLNPGEIVLIAPGVIHDIKAPEEGKRLIFQAETSILYELKSLENVVNLISPGFLITPAENPEVHKKIEEKLFVISNSYNEKSEISELMIYAALLEIFSLIGSNYTKNYVHLDLKNRLQLEYTEKFIFLCNYINEHFTENLNLDYIAEIAGFSKFHFARLFKKYTNVTFYKYLNQKRIANAEVFLANSEKNITEIALSTGFNNLSTFIRMFKQEKQCTPTEFRKMYIC